MKELIEQQKIGVLGIEGSYTHSAGEYFAPDAEIASYPNFTELMSAVKTGEIKQAAVPALNSSEGLLENPMLAIARSGVYAVRDAYRKIQHQVLVVPGVKSYEVIQTVYSKQEVFDQCRGILDGSLSHVETIKLGDSATSAQYVAQTGDPSKAAIGSDTSAKAYGLEILNDEPITDELYNQTRFWLVESEPRVIDGADRTVMMLDIPHTAGSLVKALMEITDPLSDEGYINFEDIGFIRIPKGHEKDSWAASTHIYLEAGLGMNDPRMQDAVERVNARPGTRLHVMGSFVLGEVMPA